MSEAIAMLPPEIVDGLTPAELAIVSALPANDAAIEAMEGDMLAGGISIEDRTSHFFSEGIYTRIAEYPAGAVIIGHKHRRQTLNFLLKGKIIVRVNGQYRLIQAPFVLNSDPGCRKIAYVVEDVVWANAHATTETNVDKIEEIFIEKSPTFLASELSRKAIA